MQPLIYLASPYSHQDDTVIQTRVEAATDATAKLIQAGHVVFSPILNTHPIAHRVTFAPLNDPQKMSEWMKYDLALLDRCDELWVLELDGWKESRGIQAEISYAAIRGKVIKHVTYPDLFITTQTNIPRPNCLKVADQLTSRDRQGDYGHPHTDFSRTGVIWGLILELWAREVARHDGPAPVPPELVGLCMVGVKLSREINKPLADNLIDMAGYIRTVEMVQQYKS